MFLALLTTTYIMIQEIITIIITISMKNLRGHFTLSVGGKLTESNNFNIFDPFGQCFVAIKLFFDYNNTGFINS